MEENEETVARVEQNGYDIGVKETKDTLRAQVTGVCRGYCLQVWTEALNLARVGASSNLRKTENIFYPPTLCIIAQPSSQTTTAPEAPETAQLVDASTLKATLKPSKEPSKESIKAKRKKATKDKAPEQSKPPPAAKEASKEKEVAKDKALEPSSQSAAKADPPPPTSSYGIVAPACICHALHVFFFVFFLNMYFLCLTKA